MFTNWSDVETLAMVQGAFWQGAAKAAATGASKNPFPSAASADTRIRIASS